MKGILWGIIVSAAAMLAFVGWLVIQAPRGGVSQPAAAAAPREAGNSQQKLTRDEQRAESLIRLRMENNGELKFRDFYTQNYPAAVHVQVHFEVQEWGGQTSQHAWTIVFSLDGKELNTTKKGTLSKAPTREERVESLQRKIQRELGPHRKADIRLFHETERGNDVFVEAEYEVKKPNGTSVKKTWHANFEKATNALVGYDSPYQ